MSAIPPFASAASAASATSGHVDVLIVGAGLSGVSAAYHLQANCPGKSYAILEARSTLGGTWDLFRYPGVRSDSDMYTLGYSFRPWTHGKAIADGAAILEYVRETAKLFGIDRHIRYGQQVVSARWSTRDALWTVAVREPTHEPAPEPAPEPSSLLEGDDLREPTEPTLLTSRFLFICAGYYDYEEGYTPELPGQERFRGRIVHPQKWTPDVAYEGKQVVVIGSGATAVTLVPELAKRAAHVTMLQRSPTYVVSAPERDAVAEWLREHLPGRLAYSLTRGKNVAFGMAFYAYCRRFPGAAKRLIVGQVHKRMRGAVDVATHFTPSYDPWDQRICLVPDGDLFDALRDGRASVVTSEIASFTENGITLRGGDELAADLVVTATGLKLKFLGGLALEVDGAQVEPSKTMAYKGMMLSDVPNLAFSIGYTNASWTLKCDLTSDYVTRLLGYMDRHGFTQCCPRRNDPAVQEEPIMDFTSGYVRRSIDKFPRQGSRSPWKLHQNYAFDWLLLKHAKVTDRAMEFSRNGR